MRKDAEAAAAAADLRNGPCFSSATPAAPRGDGDLLPPPPPICEEDDGLCAAVGRASGCAGGCRIWEGPAISAISAPPSIEPPPSESAPSAWPPDEAEGAP